MGGGEQGNPALDQFQQYQQEQQYKDLGKTFQQSLQGVGASVAQPTAMPGSFSQDGEQPGQPGAGPQGPYTAATGPLFGGGGGPGGISEEQLAQLLRALGYGG